MSAIIPFEPNIKAGTAGETVSVTVSTTVPQATSLNCTGFESPSILVTGFNSSPTLTTPAYVRMAVEASISVNISNTDTPIIATPQTPSIRLYANPNPLGITNIAVFVTVAPSAAMTFWFTAGQGGI